MLRLNALLDLHLLQRLQTEIEVEQGWTKLRLARLDHSPVVCHAQCLTELHLLHSLLCLRRVCANLPLVRVDHTLGHVYVDLEGLVWVSGLVLRLLIGKTLGEPCRRPCTASSAGRLPSD